MPIPFQTTWRKLSNVPVDTHLVEASLDRATGVLQAFSSTTVANFFIGVDPNTRVIFNSSYVSFDAGESWSTTYDGNTDGDGYERKVVFKTFSLDTPTGTYYYQLRYHLRTNFLDANGAMTIGAITLHVADFADPDFVEDGIGGFALLQTLYSWPAVDGGVTHAGFGFGPSAAAPILIPGSGPAGEDAFWMAIGFDLVAGGGSFDMNRLGLWRSLDGFVWEQARDLLTDPVFTALSFSPQEFFLAPNGRAIISSASSGVVYTDDTDLATAVWAISGGAIGFPGHIELMYGGTLLTSRNGTLISGGSSWLSCDQGANFFADPDSPNVPVNSVARVLKLGPTEAILITDGFVSPTTETVAYYSSDGGETWAGGIPWLASTIGESPVGTFLRSDGTPIVVTRLSVYGSTEKALGVAGVRTRCPLANAGLANARRLVLCGGVITPDCQD